ncbi:hypothetical protein [Undibacterium pigrum]|uniref:Uncharacterized protein n=1 Tax=Undibacterium pigrum TaxID=401470 RepID=A0A318JG91_9BURK|nr:hypothetical protein [Undibacterium pigrum]PXX46795.1 hypothetical protein DFR42_101371 [Undibacterium pigrum]
MVSFNSDIKPIFARYTACMKRVVLGDTQGTANLELDDYECVKRFYYQVQVAIHGYDEAVGAPPLLVKDGPDKGKPVKASHPMPPGGEKSRMDQKKIDLYDQWVKEGMHP